MLIRFVGVGSAFTDERYYQSMYLIKSHDNKKMLIDCGSDARFALKHHGISNSNISDEIDAVYISHLHGDHIGGLEWIAFCTYFSNRKKLKLYMQEDLMEEAWHQTLRGGLQTVQGKRCSLDTFFELYPIKSNGSFIWEDMEFSIVQMVHIVSEFSFRNSFGLMIRDFSSGKSVFFTTDTQFAPNQLKDFYNMSDLIIHDCETAPYYSGVHAHYDDLRTLSEGVKKKMILTHYNPDPVQKARDDGFMGFANRRMCAHIDKDEIKVFQVQDFHDVDKFYKE